jgi:hypothetical protein
MGMHPRIIGVLLFSLLAFAPAAGAQPGDRFPTVDFDTLGLPPDAEPLSSRRLRGMGNCGTYPNVVVANTADLRRLRMFPQCADAPLPEPVGRMMVGVSVMGDCHTWYRLDAFRSESRREYRVRLQRRYGGCRAGGYADAWLELPPLPPGWTVAFTEERLERDVEIDFLDGDWRYIRVRDDDSDAARIEAAARAPHFPSPAQSAGEGGRPPPP